MSNNIVSYTNGLDLASCYLNFSPLQNFTQNAEIKTHSGFTINNSSIRLFRYDMKNFADWVSNSPRPNYFSFIQNISKSLTFLPPCNLLLGILRI